MEFYLPNRNKINLQTQNKNNENGLRAVLNWNAKNDLIFWVLDEK